MKERMVALTILVFSFVYLAGSIKLKVGTLSQPEAGFVPAGFAIALIIAAGVNLYTTFQLPNEQCGSWRTQIVPIGIGISLVAYPFMLEPFSYIIATFIVMFFLLRLLRFKSMLICFLTAFSSSLISYIVFSKLLRVVLPSGFIEDIILRL